MTIPKHSHIFVLIVLFVGLIFVGNINKDEPYSSAGDTSRDYMVAHAIANGDHLPYSGPANGVFDYLGNSPLYYYLISIPFFFNNSHFMMAYLQIIAKILTCLSIFALTRLLFDIKTATIAAVIYVLVHTSIMNQDVIWQPYAMLPVLYLGFYCLTLALKRRQVKKMKPAYILLGLATALNNMALAFAPIFLAITLKLANNKFTTFILISSLYPLTLLILYMPRLVFLITTEPSFNTGITFFLSGSL